MCQAMKIQEAGGDSDQFTIDEATRLKDAGNAAYKARNFAAALQQYHAARRTVLVQCDPFMDKAGLRPRGRDAVPAKQEAMARLMTVCSNNRAATLLEMSKLNDAGVMALAPVIASTWTGGRSLRSADQGRQFVLQAAEKELLAGVVNVCARWPDLKAKGEARLQKVRAGIAAIEAKYTPPAFAYTPCVGNAWHGWLVNSEEASQRIRMAPFCRFCPLVVIPEARKRAQGFRAPQCWHSHVQPLIPVADKPNAGDVRLMIEQSGVPPANWAQLYQGCGLAPTSQAALYYHVPFTLFHLVQNVFLAGRTHGEKRTLCVHLVGVEGELMCQELLRTHFIELVHARVTLVMVGMKDERSPPAKYWDPWADDIQIFQGDYLQLYNSGAFNKLAPDLFVALNADLLAPAYTWRPTLEKMAAFNVPVLFTEYYEWSARKCVAEVLMDVFLKEPSEDGGGGGDNAGAAAAGGGAGAGAAKPVEGVDAAGNVDIDVRAVEEARILPVAKNPFRQPALFMPPEGHPERHLVKNGWAFGVLFPTLRQVEI